MFAPLKLYILFIPRFLNSNMTLYDVVLQPQTLAPVSLNQISKRLPTEESNMRNYTPRQVKRAKIAREQMSVLGFPT